MLRQTRFTLFDLKYFTEREDHAVLNERTEDHVVPEERREDQEVLKEKGLLLVDHEKVPHGFGLTGDYSSHTADGAESLNHRLLLLFLRNGTPDWAEGEGRTVHLWVF